MSTSDTALDGESDGDQQLSVEKAREIGPPKPHKNTRKGIPLERFLYLKVEKKLSDAEIGKILGCSTRNVGKRLEKIRGEWDTLPYYKKYRADILTQKQREIVSAITPSKIKGAKLSELTKSHKELYESERLERGQSTANIHTYAETVQRRLEKEAEREKLIKEMGVAEVRGVRLLPEV